MTKDNVYTKYLNKYFKLKEFRAGQPEIIDSLCTLNDTLVVMPTGGGKSLCYQLPAMIMEGTAIVISPLIALMKDQIDSLEELNIPAVTINSSISESQLNDTFNEILNNKHKIIYIAPERLYSRKFLDLISHIKVSFIAVDEAHCISEWGHDFRPSYLNIRKFVEDINVNLPIIALTATATPEVQKDIIAQLGMKKVNKFIRGFNRPNLIYHTEFVFEAQKAKRIFQIVSKSKGSNIIYCGSRKKVEKYHKELSKLGLKCLLYHAGLDDAYRIQSQNDFFNSENATIIATNAFGMGVDKPNVRNVIHTDMTQSPEAYYQEAGRAGRDSKPANCYILYNPLDRNLQEFFIDNTYPENSVLTKIFNFILSNSDKDDNFSFDEFIISKILNIPNFAVNSAFRQFEKLNILEKNNYVGNTLVQINYPLSYLKINAANFADELLELIENIARYIGSEVFKTNCEIDLKQFCHKYNYRTEDVSNNLKILVFKDIITFKGSDQILKYKLKKENITNINIDKLGKELANRRNLALKKLDIVQDYIFSENCKRNFILNYFGENDITGTCGKCSACKGDNEILNYNNISLMLQVILQNNRKFTKNVLIDYLQGNKSKAIKVFEYYKQTNFSIFKNFSNEDIESLLKIAYLMKLFDYSEEKYHLIYITKSGKEFTG